MRPAAIKICKPSVGSSWLRKRMERKAFIKETAFITELADVPGVVRVQAPCTKLPDKVMVYLRCVYHRVCLEMSSSHQMFNRQTLLLQSARGTLTAPGVVFYQPWSSKVLSVSFGSAALQGVCQQLSLICVLWML